jgi:hypothetical protein
LQCDSFTTRRPRDTAKALGINFMIVPQTPLEDGIHAARMILPRCFLDGEKCRVGLEALGGSADRRRAVPGAGSHNGLDSME